MRRPRPAALPGLALAAVMALAASAGGPALGYVRTTTETNKAFRWADPRINVQLYTANPPPYLTREKLLAAAQASAATWSQPQVECTSITLSVTEVNGEEAPVAYDKNNRITFRRVEWRKTPCDPAKESCAPYDGRALAITSVFALKSDGTVLDSDMELNAVNYRWADVAADGSTLNTPGEKIHDLQNTMTHEFGHLIGLDHNCYDSSAGRPRAIDNLGQPVPNCNDATAVMRAATMFNSASPLDIDKRDLTADDIQAVCEVYPKGQTPVNPPGDDPETGCGVAGGGAPASQAAPWLLLVGLGAVAVRLRARRRP
jgi:hypothetical protein